MLFRLLRSLKLFSREERGGYAVEFAIIMPVFLLLVFGIVDFGHAWYMRQMMVNASREGARYGTRYQTNALGNRVLPKDLAPTIANYVLKTSAENGGKGGWDLKNLLPTTAYPEVTPSGTAATESNPSVVAGEQLIVTVNATKNWLVIGKLIPTLGNSISLSASTGMLCE